MRIGRHPMDCWLFDRHRVDDWSDLSTFFYALTAKISRKM